jgi:hypothetical protein
MLIPPRPSAAMARRAGIPGFADIFSPIELVNDEDDA